MNLVRSFTGGTSLGFGFGLVPGPKTRNRPSSCRDERPVLPRYHPFSTTSVAALIGRRAFADRCCPDNAGALRRSLVRGRSPSKATPFQSGAPGSIRPRSVPARTDRRVSVGGGSRTTSPDHSLVFDWPRVWHATRRWSTALGQRVGRERLVARATGAEQAAEK